MPRPFGVEATIVADIERAVGADRGSIRPAAGPRDDLLAPALPAARDRAGPDLHDQYGPVSHHDRPFWRAKLLRDDLAGQTSQNRSPVHFFVPMWCFSGKFGATGFIGRAP